MLSKMEVELNSSYEFIQITSIECLNIHGYIGCLNIHGYIGCLNMNCYIRCLNIHGYILYLNIHWTHVTANNPTNNNGVFFLFQI